MKNAHWEVNEVVKVGFLALVTRRKMVDGSWLLTNLSGDKIYHFMPYQGVSSVSDVEAEQLINDDDYRSARKADLATAHVAKVARIDSLFA